MSRLNTPYSRDIETITFQQVSGLNRNGKDCIMLPHPVNTFYLKTNPKKSTNFFFNVNKLMGDFEK